MIDSNTQWVIRCDSDGVFPKGCAIEFIGATHEPVEKVEKRALESGWFHDSGFGHYCASCAKESGFTK